MMRPAYKGNTANDKNTGLTILHKKVIYSKFMRIGRNILLRYVPSIRVTREMTRILDNFTQKSDLFKIYANWAQHFC